jgi:type IV secretion system protein VirB8
MNDQSREALDAYYADAASWNRDRLAGLRSSHRLAWWIAGGAALIAVLEAFALALLMPLKTVEPYTLLVDRTTGYVQALKPLNPDKVAADTALTQSYLVQYVIAREGFDIDTLNTNYRKVAMLSAESERSSYLQGMQVTNPQSPLIVYPRNTLIEARVKSVSPIGKNVALVRFDTVRSDGRGQVEGAMSWVSVIRYRYSGEPLKLEDRFINPLGFQVVRYRRDPEAMPVVNAAPGVAAAGMPTTVPVNSAYSPAVVGGTPANANGAQTAVTVRQ